MVNGLDHRFYLTRPVVRLNRAGTRLGRGDPTLLTVLVMWPAVVDSQLGERECGVLDEMYK
jgi:hypothetical protein